jgi:hypothetical protein
MFQMNLHINLSLDLKEILKIKHENYRHFFKVEMSYYQLDRRFRFKICLSILKS